MAISTGLSAIGSILGGGNAQEKAASAAAKAQVQAAERGIQEQRRQFDELTELLKPYMNAGERSLIGQLALAGLEGSGAQQAAITALEQGPQYEALVRQGEEALLQQASATGGLRGGNDQAALAQFRPQMLSNLIEQQYSRLGGLTNIGQASAARQAATGQSTAANISNLMQQQGAARAGAELAKGQAAASRFGDIMGMLGSFAGMSGPGMARGTSFNPGLF